MEIGRYGSHDCFRRTLLEVPGAQKPSDVGQYIQDKRVCSKALEGLRCVMANGGERSSLKTAQMPRQLVRYAPRRQFNLTMEMSLGFGCIPPRFMSLPASQGSYTRLDYL
jgi:hypothetical protein